MTLLFNGPQGLSVPAVRRQFENAFDTMFDSFFQDFFSSRDTIVNRLKGSGKFYPKIDIVTDAEKYVVRAAVPGVKTEDLKVEVEGEWLKLSGRMSDEFRSDEKAGYHVRELHKSSFEREIALPDYVEGDPNASHKDGILTLTWQVKKPEETASTRKMIPISAG